MIPQNERVLRYMRDNGSITQWEALRDLGVMRLASRISDLKNAGFQIGSRFVESTNRYDEKIRYKQYYILKEIDNV